METEIEEILKQIRTFLDKYGEKGWANQFVWLEEDWVAAQSPNSTNGRKLVALQRIREIIGGMGSFNDVRIDHCAGHLVKPEEVQNVNVELRRLRTKLYLLVENEIIRLTSNDNAAKN